jgi:hypothetical protein
MGDADRTEEAALVIENAYPPETFGVLAEQPQSVQGVTSRDVLSAARKIRSHHPAGGIRRVLKQRYHILRSVQFRDCCRGFRFGQFRRISATV